MNEQDLKKWSLVIDMGSHKIKGILGFLNENQELVHVTETVESAGIKEGCVKNLEESKGALEKMLKLLKNRFYDYLKKNDIVLEKNMKVEFKKAYVGLTASHLQGIYNPIERNLPHSEVTDELLAQMMEDNKNAMARFTDYDLISSNVVSAIADGYSVDRPVGSVCNTIRIEYHNVLAKKDILKNLRLCFDKLGIEIVPILSSSALADMCLTNEQRQQGVVLANIGAQVTAVSVYKYGKFIYEYDLPTGSNRITQDLMELRISKSQAEMVKRNISAMAGLTSPFNFKLKDCSLVFQSEVVEQIIGKRVEKIAGKIEKVIERISVGSEIQEIVLVGGGAKQNGLKEKMESCMGVDATVFNYNGNCDSRFILLALLMKAEGNSVVLLEEVIKTQTKVKEDNKTTKNSGGGFWHSLFVTVKENSQGIFEENTEKL